jgi:hypothetical protein
MAPADLPFEVRCDPALRGEAFSDRVMLVTMVPKPGGALSAAVLYRRVLRGVADAGGAPLARDLPVIVHVGAAHLRSLLGGPGARLLEFARAEEARYERMDALEADWFLDPPDDINRLPRETRGRFASVAMRLACCCWRSVYETRSPILMADAGAPNALCVLTPPCAELMDVGEALHALVLPALRTLLLDPGDVRVAHVQLPDNVELALVASVLMDARLSDEERAERARRTVAERGIGAVKRLELLRRAAAPEAGEALDFARHPAVALALGA